MFCVITEDALPSWINCATARWPRLGCAARRIGSISKRRFQVSRRAFSDRMKSENSIGTCFVHNPPGLRKSGIPDSVLMPAPVNSALPSMRANETMSGS